jgi:hypothetical protein
MAEKITAYRCEWGCGRNVITSKKRMEYHENNYCAKNPKLKACPTCIHDIDGWDDERYWCELEVRVDGVNVVYNCEKWSAIID